MLLGMLAITIITIIIILVLGALIKALSSNGISGIKVMLLGINITLVGGIIAVDPNSNLGGAEYLVVFLGLIISLLGAGKSN